ncbi:MULTISPECIES: hypothetical protein [unclassified Streptomyces]|uniref:hypothetical protein n=1 Tax=Streptomyces sp. NPDC127532 TaxID=3345399 RepID=UPI003636439F
MDLHAAGIGMDPDGVRRRNVIAADIFSFRTATGACHGSGEHRRGRARRGCRAATRTNPVRVNEEIDGSRLA